VELPFGHRRAWISGDLDNQNFTFDDQHPEKIDQSLLLLLLCLLLQLHSELLLCQFGPFFGIFVTFDVHHHLDFRTWLLRRWRESVQNDHEARSENFHGPNSGEDHHVRGQGVCGGHHRLGQFSDVECKSLSRLFNWLPLKLLFSKQDNQLENVAWIYVLNGLFAYVVIQGFFDTYEIAVDTVIVGFCADCDLNDGRSKPYYMSVQLVAFLEKAKIIGGDNDVVPLSD
jgi:Plasma-membrane choline transporter